MAGHVWKEELLAKAITSDGRKNVVLPLQLGDECVDARLGFRQCYKPNTCKRCHRRGAKETELRELL